MQPRLVIGFRREDIDNPGYVSLLTRRRRQYFEATEPLTSIQYLFEKPSPFGWETSMTRDMALARKKELGLKVARDHIIHLIGEKDTLSNYDIGGVLETVLSTPFLEAEMYRKIKCKLEGKKLWQDFIANYIEDISELERFLILYKAVKENCKYSWSKTNDFMMPLSQMYIFERVLALTSLASGVMYVTKTTLAELLIHHNEESISKFDSLTCINHEDLKDVYGFFTNFFKAFINNPFFISSWVRNVGIHVDHFYLVTTKVVVCICLLHLIGVKQSKLLERVVMLNSAFGGAFLPKHFVEILKLGIGEKDFSLEIIAKALQALNNPLMIVNIKNGSLEIMDATADKTNADCFWKWLENASNATHESLPNAAEIHKFLNHFVPALSKSLHDPATIANATDLEELSNVIDEMRQLQTALKICPIRAESLVNLSKKILLRQPKVAGVLDRQLLLCPKSTIPKSSQVNTAVDKKNKKFKGRSR